jgi:hypothetical protein
VRVNTNVSCGAFYRLFDIAERDDAFDVHPIAADGSLSYSEKGMVGVGNEPVPGSSYALNIKATFDKSGDATGVIQLNISCGGSSDLETVTWHAGRFT